MSRLITADCNGANPVLRDTSLGDLLTIRSSGLKESELWAILCQSVQALQDLFLSDDISSRQFIPLLTPATLKLSSKGRVKLRPTDSFFEFGTQPTLTSYLAPEYERHSRCSDSEYEKMWIFSLGETLKRVASTSLDGTSRLSKDICQVLSDMTCLEKTSRASLMYLLNVMSEYCNKRQQNRPFSHILMDLHQETVAGIEMSRDQWGPPAMPEIIPRSKRIPESTEKFSTLHRRWPRPRPYTKEVATSMEDVRVFSFRNTPGKVVRPKSMYVPDHRYMQQDDNTIFKDTRPNVDNNNLLDSDNFGYAGCGIYNTLDIYEKNKEAQVTSGNRTVSVRRNPVQRAASRLYRVGIDLPADRNESVCNCVGPEFVVKSSLPSRQLGLTHSKYVRKAVFVILLDGQKLEIACSPRSTTAGQLLELIFQEEHIEENFMFGLSALIAGDFVFIPSDTRVYKVMQSGNDSGDNLTLYLRIRFFLPSLRGIRGSQARHLLYLQLRRSILEHQLPCSFLQIIELSGLALQAEFGNYREQEHGSKDYFLLEHYVPETMTCIINQEKRLKEELVTAHISKKGLDRENAEQDFIIFTQNLPHYGGHFYTAIWMLKDNKKNIWINISAEGINLYERGKSTSHFGPQLYEQFDWKSIQTICYTKHYLCILPRNSVQLRSKLRKFKLKMDHKKSYFAFRLASVHHQFFLKLRTEYASLQSLSQQFGIPLKDVKNETNSLYKLEAYTRPVYSERDFCGGFASAAKEFKVIKRPNVTNYYRRTRSVQDLNRMLDETINEIDQNIRNQKPRQSYQDNLISKSPCLPDITVSSEKRRGVKMGTRAFSKVTPRVCRSMEAVNDHEYLEQLSVGSVSLHCSSMSIDGEQSFEGDGEAYVLDSTLQSVSQQNFFPNLQETINDTLLERLDNISFAEERILSTIVIERDINDSLGLHITEGSDGNVYVESVIIGGSAYFTNGVMRGDQVISVNGQSLLGRKYSDSLEMLKATGKKVEFVLSRRMPTFSQDDKHSLEGNTVKDGLCDKMVNLSGLEHPVLNKSTILDTRLKRSSSMESQLEKHIFESCHDSSNVDKHGNKSFVKGDDMSLKPDHGTILLKLPNDNDRAVIVDMIPKTGRNSKTQQNASALGDTVGMKRESTAPIRDPNSQINYYMKSEQMVALPRSLGLSRKWKGPVRYPVTPVKKIGPTEGDVASSSEEDQVFI